MTIPLIKGRQRELQSSNGVEQSAAFTLNVSSITTLSGRRPRRTVVLAKSCRGCMPGLSQHEKLVLERARRTAFISRFIVLREGKKSRAHREIELLEWSDSTTTEELYKTLKQIFSNHGDNPNSVERDLRRAKAHADRLNPIKNPTSPEAEGHFSLWPLIEEYNKRASCNFIDSLFDYERSNSLLFGEDSSDQPKLGGWRLPRELMRAKEKESTKRTDSSKKRIPSAPAQVAVH